MKTFKQFYDLREEFDDFDTQRHPEEELSPVDRSIGDEIDKEEGTLLGMIDKSPVYLKDNQLIHDNAIIGEIKMRGPSQKLVVFVTRGYEGERRKIQAAIDDMFRKNDMQPDEFLARHPETPDDFNRYDIPQPWYGNR
jgi:hypothetical protein